MKSILSFLLVAHASILCGQGFSENAAALGLAYGYQNGEYGGGVSFVDFNQDGLDDLTFATGNGQPIRFHLNTGSGFTEIPALVDNTTEVKQVLWIDYDNDSDLDLYVTSHTQNRLYKNTGDLVMEDITATCGFSDPVNEQSFCASWLDYDEDGLPDLCVSFRFSYLVGKITLYHNLGNDQFEDVTTAAGLANKGNSVLAMATLDVNNDGWEDLYIGQDFQAGCLLLLNNGNGTFSDISLSSNTAIQNNTMTVTVGDYNGDGWMDIYLTDTGVGNSLLRNQGNNTFVDVAYTEGVAMNMFTWGAIFLDADNDMDLDLHVNGTYSCSTYENPGNGTPYTNASTAWGFNGVYNYGVGLAMGDYNGDGRVDFAKNCASFTQNKFWTNEFTGNHFLTIDLHGTVSNSMAIGAVVEVVAGGIHQRRRVGCGESFSSQHSYSQFFGLGENESADSVMVYWPSGIVTTLTNVAADQKISITETMAGDGCTDATACNYDPDAAGDDGSCYYAEQYYECDGSCMYDVDADGVCDELEVAGCTDPGACNYDTSATDDNGFCNYPDPGFTCNGECLFDSDWDGICDEWEVAGCMDGGACNYDPSATDDNGTCYYAQTYYDCAGYCWLDDDQDGVCNELEIPGCMDGLACNYDPAATDNVGCQYLTLSDINGTDEPVVGESHTYTYPYTAGSAYNWQITGGTITTGQGTNEVTVEWIAPGAASLTVNEAWGTCALQSTLNVSVVTFIKDEERIAMHVYPNPAGELLSITFGDDIPSLMRITDACGSMVDIIAQPRPVLLLDTHAYANGVYIIQAIGTHGSHVIRFVVEH